MNWSKYQNNKDLGDLLILRTTGVLIAISTMCEEIRNDLFKLIGSVLMYVVSNVNWSQIAETINFVAFRFSMLSPVYIVNSHWSRQRLFCILNNLSESQFVLWYASDYKWFCYKTAITHCHIILFLLFENTNAFMYKLT